MKEFETACAKDDIVIANSVEVVTEVDVVKEERGKVVRNVDKNTFYSASERKKEWITEV